MLDMELHFSLLFSVHFSVFHAISPPSTPLFPFTLLPFFTSFYSHKGYMETMVSTPLSRGICFAFGTYVHARLAAKG